MVVERTEKTSLKQREKKPLTKKRKTILISFISVVAVLLIVGGVILGVYLSKQNNAPVSPSEPLVYKEYVYYIDHEDTTGFKINTSFLGNLQVDDLSRVDGFVSEGIILTDDLILKVNTGVSLDAIGEFEFLYKSQKLASVKVFVIEADGYISTASELYAINGSNKTFIVREPLDLSGNTARISRFTGNLHFNHNALKGFDASSGALFKELSGVTITGLDMVDVVGTRSINESMNVGVLADNVYNLNISNSTVSGNFNVYSNVNANASLYVGGIIGYASAVKRKDYTEFDATYKNIESSLNITVSGSGDLKIGGLIGGGQNVKLEKVTNKGNIALNVSETEVQKLGNLCLGGVIGTFVKEYDTVLSTTTLDVSSGFYSYGDIVVNVTGGGAHNQLNVGGVVGYLKNHSVYNVFRHGITEINVTRTYLNVGGIVGKAQNDTGISMIIKGAKAEGEINVYSLAGVYAGGIIGVGQDVTYAKIDESSVTPTLNTEPAKVQGTQVTNAIIAKNN